MHTITAYTSHTEVPAAVAELQDQLKLVSQPKCVLYFASAAYPSEKIAAAMEEAFSGATVFGCSTAGEIVSGKMLKHSIVAMALDQSIIGDIVIQSVSPIEEQIDVSSVFSVFEKHYHISMRDADPTQYVGIILFDGLSFAEERWMDKIGNATDVVFIGGSAGDDLKFSRTYVYAHGRAYTNTVLLALLKPNCKFDIIKTQSFQTLPQQLVATKVEEAHRAVIEFNNKPAITAYAEALGKSIDTVAESFMSNPLGLMVGGEPYVRSPQRISDGKMIFYCTIKEGMDLQVLQSSDMIRDTREAILEKKNEFGELQALINFHCILRTLDLESHGLTEEYGHIFDHIPTIGFSTYGEEYIGHMNQTATMLAFAA